MSSKSLLFALSALVASLAAGTAGAQTSWVEIDEQVTVPPLGATADDVEDWDVHSANGDKVGEVEEVIGRDAGAPTALVIDFDDDAGYGDRDDIIIPLDAFERNGERLVLGLDPGAITGLETYDD